MSVSAHLGINLAEYDRSIRTFIPHYEEMLDQAAAVLTPLRPRATIVELGVGTGALASRCLGRAPDARFVGIDSDPAILEMARRRLRRHGRREVELIPADFSSVTLPRCDAIIASLALHHVRTARAKRALYVRCGQALSRHGLFVNADVHLASDAALRSVAHAEWRAHLSETYGTRQADAFLRAWSREDVYFTLEQEAAMLEAAGFEPGIFWRHSCFAVMVGRRRDDASSHAIAPRLRARGAGPLRRSSASR
jgi:tRNA (cmo5U34)-methyltransferase